MSGRMAWLFLLTLLAGNTLSEAAPFPADNSDSTNAANSQTKLTKTTSDVPVEQLEKLKLKEQSASEGPGSTQESLYLETHKFEAAVKENGELVARVSQQGAAASGGRGEPRVHSETEVQAPRAGVHELITQDGDKITVQDAHKEKVFKGAARLVQPSSVAGDAPPAPPAPPAHTNNGNRRSYRPDIANVASNNERSSYPGVPYSPLDMAEYVFWTGDERGVTLAVQQFLQDGLMSKNEAIVFLQEIKYNIEYLLSHFSRPSEEYPQQRLSNLLLQQFAKDKSSPYESQSRPQYPLVADPMRQLSGAGYNMQSVLPIDPRYELVKRTSDPMVTSNIIDTSDYERESTPPITEEEYEDMMTKMRAADSLYTQYTLEEVIYQLAKMMFSQTLDRPGGEARVAMQRFIDFLELEAERGQLSRNIEKKVLDVMISALSDTVAEHPELLQPRDSYGPSVGRYTHPVLEMNGSESPLSRALLAAYKEEIAKGQLLQKMKGFSSGN